MYSSEPAARTGEASVRGLHHPEPGGDGRMAGWEAGGTFGSFRGSSACLQRADGGWGMGWRCCEWCGEGMGREASKQDKGGERRRDGSDGHADCLLGDQASWAIGLVGFNVGGSSVDGRRALLCGGAYRADDDDDDGAFWVGGSRQA